MLNYIDSKIPNAVVKFDILSTDVLDLRELIEAYNENDFDVYIVSVSSNIKPDENVYTSFCQTNNINTEAVMFVIGSDTVAQAYKEIKKFVLS